MKRSVLALLALAGSLVLALPYVHDTVSVPAMYTWPAVAGKEKPTEADWQALRAIMAPAQVAHMKQDGIYIGFRLGIAADGDWAFFLAGD